jgi:hypothetical protein
MLLVRLYLAMINVFVDENSLLKLFLFGSVDDAPDTPRRLVQSVSCRRMRSQTFILLHRSSIWVLQTSVVSAYLPYVAFRLNMRTVLLGLFSVTHSIVLLGVQTNGINSGYFYALLCLFSLVCLLLVSREELAKWAPWTRVVSVADLPQPSPQLLRHARAASMVSAISMRSPESDESSEDPEEAHERAIWTMPLRIAVPLSIVELAQMGAALGATSPVNGDGANSPYDDREDGEEGHAPALQRHLQSPGAGAATPSTHRIVNGVVHVRPSSSTAHAAMHDPTTQSPPLHPDGRRSTLSSNVARLASQVDVAFNTAMNSPVDNSLPSSPVDPGEGDMSHLVIVAPGAPGIHSSFPAAGSVSTSVTPGAGSNVSSRRSSFDASAAVAAAIAASTAAPTATRLSSLQHRLTPLKGHPRATADEKPNSRRSSLQLPNVISSGDTEREHSYAIIEPTFHSEGDPSHTHLHLSPAVSRSSSPLPPHSPMEHAAAAPSSARRESKRAGLSLSIDRTPLPHQRSSLGAPLLRSNQSSSPPSAGARVSRSRAGSVSVSSAAPTSPCVDVSPGPPSRSNDNIGGRAGGSDALHAPHGVPQSHGHGKASSAATNAGRPSHTPTPSKSK